MLRWQVKMFDMSEFQEWNLPEEEAAFLGE